MTKGSTQFRIVVLCLIVTMHFPGRSRAATSEYEASQSSPIGGSSRSTLEPNSTERNTVVTIEGCLVDRGENGFYLADIKSDQLDPQTYVVIGASSQLRRYSDEWDTVQIVGSTEKSNDPPTLHVKSIKVVHKPVMREPALSTSGWHSFSNKNYGVSIRYPPSFDSTVVSTNYLGNQPNGEDESPNVVNPDGVTRLLSLEIPSDIFYNTTFVGGDLSIYASDEISNAPTCKVFGRWRLNSDGSDGIDFRTVHGFKYSEAVIGSAAGGTAYPSNYFHTFQNGRCYAVDINLAIGNVRTTDFGCQFDNANVEALINSILANVSFFKPATKVTLFRTSPAEIPVINSFDVTSTYVSWSVTGADYIQINFKCESGVTVHSSDLDCAGDTYGHNFPVKGTVMADFSNRGDPTVPLAITLQPFSNAVGDPKWSNTRRIVLYIRK
jgi:hypothetical protein